MKGMRAIRFGSFMQFVSNLLIETFLNIHSNGRHSLLLNQMSSAFDPLCKLSKRTVIANRISEQLGQLLGLMHPPMCL